MKTINIWRYHGGYEWVYPLVNIHISNWKMDHLWMIYLAIKWWFLKMVDLSIAMLNYQRVYSPSSGWIIEKSHVVTGIIPIVGLTGQWLVSEVRKNFSADSSTKIPSYLNFGRILQMKSQQLLRRLWILGYPIWYAAACPLWSSSSIRPLEIRWGETLGDLKKIFLGIELWGYIYIYIYIYIHI